MHWRLQPNPGNMGIQIISEVLQTTKRGTRGQPVSHSNRYSLHLAAVLISSLGWLGCTGSEADRVQRNPLGDTLLVHSVSPQFPDTLHPREATRIGRSDGPIEYIFNQIYSFTVVPSGEVLVHDEGEGIRRFDATGQYLGHLANLGQGPEEVRYVLGLSGSPDGTLAAYDLGNARITLSGRDGSLQTVRRPDGMPPYNEDAILFHRDGSLWVGISPQVFPDGGIPHPRPVFARVAPSGALVDTIFTPRRLGEVCPILSDRQNRSGFWEDRREPYWPKAKWSLGPDGALAFGCSADYSFDLVLPGEPVVRISRPWTPLQMSEEEKDFKVKWGSIPRLPSSLPAYARIVLPGDGRVWVWPTQPSGKYPLSQDMQESFGETHTWLVGWTGAFDVFSGSGEWLAVVKLPSEARYSGYPTQPSVFIRGDTIWSLAVDSLDVQYVVRYVVDDLPAGR